MDVEERSRIWRGARAYAVQTEQSVLDFIAGAVRDRLDFETAPHCPFCDSISLSCGEGSFETGVTGPDGGREVRTEPYARCGRCGRMFDDRGVM